MLMDSLKELFTELNIFLRNKKPLEAKVKTFLLYLTGLSYNQVAQIISQEFNSVSKTSAYNWVQKMQEAYNLLCCPIKKKRKCVAIDETKIKVNGQTYFVWAAIDVKTKEILAIETSQIRNYATCFWFLQDVIKSCKYYRSTLFITDRGPWYYWPFIKLRLKHKFVSGRKRSYIERFFRTLKDRTRRFYNNFTVKINVLEHVSRFFKVWALFFYNKIRIHETLNKPPCLS